MTGFPPAGARAACYRKNNRKRRPFLLWEKAPFFCFTEGKNGYWCGEAGSMVK